MLGRMSHRRKSRLRASLSLTLLCAACQGRGAEPSRPVSVVVPAAPSQPPLSDPGAPAPSAPPPIAVREAEPPAPASDEPASAKPAQPAPRRVQADLPPPAVAHGAPPKAQRTPPRSAAPSGAPPEPQGAPREAAPPEPSPAAEPPEPQPREAVPPVSPPAIKRVVVPSTAYVRVEVPAGLQRWLDADPRMQPWLSKVIPVIDRCYAGVRSRNPGASGTISFRVTMHRNARPSPDIESLPGQLSGVVTCATGQLLRTRMPLFTGNEGETHRVRVRFGEP